MGKTKTKLRRLESIILSMLMILTLFSGFCRNAYAAGTLTLRFHYSRTDGNYSSWNIWGWCDSGEGAWYGFNSTDSNGKGVATISGIPGSAEKFGFLVATKSWTKDYETDRYVNLSDVTSGVVDVYVSQGNASFTREVSTSGYVLTDAAITGSNSLTVNWSSKQDSIPSLKVYDTTLGIERTDIVSKEYVGETGFKINFTNKLYLGHEYKLEGSNIDAIYAKVNYDSEYFENNLTYDGNDLGCTYTKTATTFKVWAPTADSMSLLVFDKGTIEENSKCVGQYDMLGGDINSKGVWTKTITGDYKNYYYVYKVSFADKTEYCMDPYAVSGCTVNDDFFNSTATSVDGIMSGQRSMITDLDSTDPVGWANDGHVVTAKKTNASVYELSVRDFSSDINSGISEENRMKYLAFTESGTTLRNEGVIPTGMDYIKNLGVSYIQIMPSYDFAGTDEVTMENYNWGYNPVNYNIPEGAFSTNPYDGNVRVNEYKQMVQAIHKNDMGVIMDVVYNHVNNADTFCYNVLVPGYFVRESNGSGCGNDVASERTMVRKYIVDSCKYWATEYHLDGFRFDLVGLLDTETMNQVRAALNEINPNMLIYGEGWSLGTSPYSSVDLATQGNTYKMPGVGMFNDVIRSDMRGGNDDTSTGYATGDMTKTVSLKKDIVANTWFTNDPTQIINYASCHDNYTLWDKIQKSAYWAWESSQVKMNKIVAALNITSQGIPLFQAGEEFLRTKNGDENSYKSPDSVNKIDWTLLETNKAVADYYAGLLEFRNNHEGLCMDSREVIDSAISFLSTGDDVIAYTIDGEKSGDVADKILIAFNPYLADKTITLPSGTWKVCVNGDTAGTDVISTASGTYTLPEYTSCILVQGETKKPEEVKELEATLTVDKASYEVGDNVVLSASAKNGTGDYTYQFVMKNVSTGKNIILQDYSTKTSYTGKMTTQGTKIFFVNVKDSASNVKTSENISVVVNNSALKVTLKVNGSTANTQLNVGESVKLEPVVTGGAGGYTYQYIMKTSASPNGMILKNFSIQSSYTGLLTSVGTKIFSVSVKDKAGNIVVSDDVTVNVVKGIKVVLKVNDSTSDINLAVGGSVTLVPVVTGGEGKYTYQYLMTNANTGSSIILKNFSTQTSYTGPLISAGTKIFTVNVKDSSGNVVSSNSVVVTVTNSSAKVVLKVNGSSSDISLKVGQSVTLQPVVTGVTGNCTYQYVMTNVNTGSTIVLNNFSAQTSYTGPLTSAGQKIFKVNVKDSSGVTIGSNTIKVTVVK